jgi:hypothetical protein
VERCLSGAKAVYQDREWSLVDDYLNGLLGELASSKSDLETALKYFKELLHESRQSRQNQQVYMAKLVETYKVAGLRLRARIFIFHSNFVPKRMHGLQWMT